MNRYIYYIYIVVFHLGKYKKNAKNVFTKIRMYPVMNIIKT
jgi:hypothetical protein